MSARADLCGGRSAMIVPTATSSRNKVSRGRKVGMSDKWFSADSRREHQGFA
jgi:hypothetical protein